MTSAMPSVAGVIKSALGLCASRAEARGSLRAQARLRRCRVKCFFNINHWLTNVYLEHVEFKLQGLMLPHGIPAPL